MLSICQSSRPAGLIPVVSVSSLRLGGRLRPLLPVSRECPEENETSPSFLEVPVVSGYPCSVRQVVIWS